MIRVGVVGGRDFVDYPLLEAKLDELLADETKVEVVSGGAKGADSLAEYYAIRRDYGLTVYSVQTIEIEMYGFAKAAQMRNQLIVDDADILVAFPTANSRGTWVSVRMAQKKGIPVHIINGKEANDSKDTAG